MHIAVKINDIEKVKLLCENNADVNAAENRTNRTSLHLAITEKAVDIVKYFLSSTNVDVTILGFRDMNALNYAQTLKDESKEAEEIYQILLDHLVRFFTIKLYFEKSTLSDWKRSIAFLTVHFL